MKKTKDWKQAKIYVLHNYPKAVCFKYRKGSLFAVFSDRNIINAERLSKNPFEGKTATSMGMAWREAEEKIKSSKKELMTKQQTHKEKKYYRS